MHHRQLRRTLLTALPLVLTAAPAWAHHAMGGRTPTTFMEGLLSGLAHPLIGPDHLAFLVAVGVLTGISALPLAMPVLFVAAMTTGVALHVSGAGVAGVDIIVALSSVIAGFLIVRARAVGVAPVVCAVLFAAGGLFHGQAFAESIVGAETAPFGAYLLGLTVIQSVLAIGIALLTRRLGLAARNPATRAAGIAVIAVGLASLLVYVISGA